MDAMAGQIAVDASVVENSVWLPGWEPRPGRLARARLRSSADVQEIEKHPPETLRPGRTIYECIKAAASPHPDKAAMIFMPTHRLEDAPRVVSYAQLVAAIEQSANLFNEVAGSARSSVALILPMVPEGLMALWGAATAGISVPINPFLELRSAISIMQAAQATVLVTTADQFGGIQGYTLREIQAAVPSLQRVLYVDAADSADDFMRAIQAYPAGRFTFAPTMDTNAEAMHMPTGGTTAAPKLVRMTHGGQLTVAWNVGALMGSRPDGVVGHGMPNFHCGGTISLGLRTILFGQTLLTLTREGFRNQGVVRNFWNIARHHRMTSVLSTPTTAAAILAVEVVDATGHCLSDFHCGGSTVPLELTRAFHSRFRVWLRENWGMTELHGTTTGHPNDGQEPRVGSVGLTLPFFRTKAIVVDEGNRFISECAPGERGVLVVQGPTITAGYADSRLNDQFFVQAMPDGRVWANTGDLGTVDADGYVWVFGRAKDLIIRGGHNIDPRPIEEVLAQHPAVFIAAAIGRPNPSKGELPIAYVQLKPQMHATPEELIRFCAGRIQERAALPVDIIVVEAIPLTAVGKVSKPALRADAMKRVVEAVATEVIGAAGNFRVTIDQSGLRPSATLIMQVGAEEAEIVEPKLRCALAGYEFATCIERATETAPH